MKKTSFVILFLFLFTISKAQTRYFKGEWATANTTILYTCLLKLEIKTDSIVTGEFIWTFLNADCSDNEMVDNYKNKKNLRAREFVNGKCNQQTGYVELNGDHLDDPHEIIGLTRYFLKLSADKKVLYGYTNDTEGEHPGLFYAIDEGKKIQRQFNKSKPIE
jgi:hypothetical protein